MNENTPNADTVADRLCAQLATLIASGSYLYEWTDLCDEREQLLDDYDRRHITTDELDEIWDRYIDDWLCGSVSQRFVGCEHAPAPPGYLAAYRVTPAVVPAVAELPDRLAVIVAVHTDTSQPSPVDWSLVDQPTGRALYPDVDRTLAGVIHLYRQAGRDNIDVALELLPQWAGTLDELLDTVQSIVVARLTAHAAWPAAHHRSTSP